MISKEISILASSDTASGAVRVTAGGDAFDLVLEDSIQIPANAINTRVTLLESTIWWSVPNIIAGSNDQMQVVDTGADSGVAGTFVLTIPPGLYSAPALNEAIARELINEGAFSTGDPLISISADTATNLIQIQANFIGISVDFTIANTFREILFAALRSRRKFRTRASWSNSKR